MNRSTPEKTFPSFEEFLAFEETSQVKHEFVYGNLFVMAGDTDRHDHVANALRAHLFFAAQRGKFRVHGSDMLVRTPEEVGYYPDALIVTDTSLDTPRVKRRPSIVFEVLSESTASIDRGEKLHQYRSIPSLVQYVLLSQDEPIADVYSKQPSGIWQHEVLKADAQLDLPSIGFVLPLAELYENLPPAEQV